MNVNIVKLCLAALIALACIIALAVDADANSEWAAPILGLVVGYVIGNARVSDVPPIIDK